MTYYNLVLIRYSFTWVRTPANDNWPVDDEIAQHLGKKVA